MTNILDQVRSDFRTFAQRSFNSVDALILCELSYINMPKSIPLYNSESKVISTTSIYDLLRFEDFSSMFSSGVAKVDKFRQELLFAVASNPRYRGIRVGEILERFDKSNAYESCEQQFAGVTFDLSACEGIDNPNTIVVAFRGTDNTLVGWKEDFNMAFRCPIPAQESAAEYLISVTQRYSKYIAKKASLLQKISSFFAKSTNLKRDNRDNNNHDNNNNRDNNNKRNNSPNIIVTGHSKGGNMASYATMRLDAENEKLGNLVSKIYSMDGPGFANDVVDTSVFSRVASRIERVVPQSSIIGLLMDNGLPYKVARADSVGLMQHFGMYWHVEDGDFDYRDEVTARAAAIAKAINSWMFDLPVEERKRRIDSVYNVLSSLGYPTFDLLGSHWSELVPKLLGMATHLDAKSYELIRGIIAAVAGVGVK